MCVAWAGHDDIVNFLLRRFHRLRVDQCNKLGFTALMKAAIQGRTRCAKLLLFAGLASIALRTLAIDESQTEVWRCRWNSTLTYVRRKIRRLLKLVHTADTDKTKLSCRVLSVSAVWTKLATRQDSFVLPRPNFQFQMFSLKYIKDYWKLGNCKLGRDKIKLSCLVANSVHTADTAKTRQDSFVLSVSVVWASY